VGSVGVRSHSSAKKICSHPSASKATHFLECGHSSIGVGVGEGCFRQPFTGVEHMVPAEGGGGGRCVGIEVNKVEQFPSVIDLNKGVGM
jgi:hypothetical protein